MKLTRTLFISSLLISCGGPPVGTPKPHSTARDVFGPAQRLDTSPTLDGPAVRDGPTLVQVGGTAPDLGLGPLYANSGAFTFPGGTHPGTVSFTNAIVMDPFTNTLPASLGTGTWTNIRASGTVFATSTADAVAAVIPDPSGVDYLVLSAFEEQPQPGGVVLGTVVHVIVLPTDFVVGRTVQLDGTDRLVVFAHGDINQANPQKAAAAISGTVTFTSGGTNVGDRITASISADFGDIQWNTPPPPPPGNGIATGNLTLGVDPTANVHCDGSLAGQESAFVSITAASIGLVGGAVNVTATTPGSYTISGSPIQSAFSASTLALDPMPDAPPDVVGGVVNGSGSGPASTMFMGTYLILDGSAATPTTLPGFVGAGYMSSAQDGFCSVDFLVELTP